MLATGGVDCWGDNSEGNLGDGTTVGSNVPVAVTGITDAVAIAGNSCSYCAVLATGGVDCWGFNGLGELGGRSAAEYSDVPVAVVAPI